MIGAQTTPSHIGLRPSDRPAAHTIVFQLLWHTVTIELPDDDAVVEQMRFLWQRAEHGVEPYLTMHYRVEGDATEGYRVFEEGDLLCVVPFTGHVNDWVYSRVYARVWDHVALSGWVRLHAGCVDLPEGRVLLVGTSGAGKSSSTVRLGLAGATVCSDESTLIRGGMSIGVPRRFHIKPGAEEHIPELAEVLRRTPTTWGEVARALDPTELGIRWRVTPARLALVCCLESVADAPSVERIHSGAAMSALIGEVFRSGNGHPDVVRELAQLLSGAPAVRVRGAGGLDLREVLSGVLRDDRAERRTDHLG